MSRPALSVAEASLRGMPACDQNRVSRAKAKPSPRGGRPKFPVGYLPESARPLWKEIVKQLAKRRTLTPGDGPHICLYVRTLSSVGEMLRRSRTEWPDD